MYKIPFNELYLDVNVCVRDFDETPLQIFEKLKTKIHDCLEVFKFSLNFSL
jgi:hypothetical protein